MQIPSTRILKSPVPKSLADRGRLLYTSRVIHPIEQIKHSAEIFEKMIVIGQYYIPLIFDIRYNLKDDLIEFDCQEDLMKLQLTQGDSEKWRQILKNFLNQKGFHEQFKPIKKIGKGNFASVYLVEKMDESHKHFAVKAFSKQAAYSEENGKECLIKQIQIMRQLNHKNTMKLYEVFESENSLYFVFQLIEGGSLHQKIKSKYKFKPSEVQYIVKCLLEGLKEMHSKKIMHRDLKPENILLRKKDSLECVIADFGLAQFSDSEIYLFTRCGTPGFVAPQVINIKDMKVKYQPICDIFSVGLILYMLLFEKSLFKSKNYNDIVKENRQSKFNFEEYEFNSVDKQTKDILMKMLKTLPEQRMSAEQCLKHNYFKLNLKDQQNDSQQEADIVQMDLKPTANELPPIMNQKNFRVKKDSCIDFKLGKQSVFTGKTESIQNVATRVSMGNNLYSQKGKISKFTRNKENVQN